MPPQAVIPLPVTASTPGEELAVVAMIACWVLAVVIALWGSIREARRYDVDRRRELAGPDAASGPTPGLAGFLDRWALWSLGFLGLGLVLLAVATGATHI